MTLGLFLLGLIAGTLWGFLHRITSTEAAFAMDASEEGPERRDMMVTALSFAEQDQPAVQWQRDQAAKYGQRFMANIKRRLPLPVERRVWISCASLAVLVLVLTLLPNPKDRILAEAKQQREWVKTQEKQTEELSKKLQAEKLVPIVKKPLLDQVSRLQKELAGQQDPLKALDELEKSMKAMEKLAKQQEEKAKPLAQIAEKMRQLKQMTALAQSLQQNNPENLDQAINELKQKMKKLSPTEKDKLREAMKKLADEIPEKNSENKQLKEALKKLEQALEKGDSAKQDEALQQLAEELAKAMAAKSLASQQSASASALSAALAKQGMSLADQMAAAGLSYSDTWSSGGSGEMLAQAGASGEPNEGEPNEVQDVSTGQGGKGSTASQGQGAGSGGQGSGSGQGTGGSGGAGSGQGAGAGLGTGGRELVTTPRDLAGKGEVKSDRGPTQGGGDIQKGGTSPTMDGASRPYAEVYENYAEEAKKSLGRSDLPQQMQGLVESYFTSINPNP
jgi:hypothetical protein